MTLLDEARPYLDALGEANRAFMLRYPGDRAARQPVHTVYGGAQLFRADTPRRLGELAQANMETYARDAIEFAQAVGFVAPGVLDPARGPRLQEAFERDPAALRHAEPAAWLAHTVFERVRAKLAREPVEDFRIDFEDGFGARSDDEEDSVARSAARELRAASEQRATPPFIGIRIKSFGEEWKLRGARTLELFIGELLASGDRQLPANFVVTLPKVTLAEQPATLVKLLELLEARHGLPRGALRMEIMIEVAQALIGPDGRSPLPGFLQACAGRCVGAHFGTYDYTASCNITAAHQAMDHGLCDLAKGMMMLAYAGTGIFLSDGGTNVMPVGPHRGEALSLAQQDDNRAAVHAAWRLAHQHIRHSLRGGFYQGWDLHPAQLPVRYAACYAFFLEGARQAGERLANFVDKAAQATLIGGVFDDAATGQGLLNYFLRAHNCGAIELPDVQATGLTAEEFGLRSFAKIIAARTRRLSAQAGEDGDG